MRLPHSPPLVRYLPVVLVLAILLSLTTSFSTQAQLGGSIGYGSNNLGNVPAAGQTLRYSFQGNQGDFVQITLRSWTGTFDPYLDLSDPDGQPLVASGTHPLSDDPRSAFASLFLPQSGVYSLQVSGENNTTGEFILQLQGRAAFSALPLLIGQPVRVSVSAVPQYVSFETPSCVTVLTISNLSDGLPFTYPFHVKLYNPQGTEIGQLYGGDALEDRIVLPANSGRYAITAYSADPDTAGNIELLLTCSEQSPPCLGELHTGELAVSQCPPCVTETDDRVCTAFALTVALEDRTGVFTWTEVEGADWYIFSIIDSAGDLLMDSPRILEGETSNTYTFNPGDLARSPFTAIVTAGAEGAGDSPSCIAEVEVTFEGTATEDCSGLSVGADIVPGARMAVVHWTAAPGAAAYLIHVYAYAEDGGLIGIRVLTAPGDATTYHLADIFPPDYNRFSVRVAAYSEAEGGGAFGDMPQGYLCDGSTDIEFDPLGPVHWGPAA